jgi:parallel beta helix pectate lyase-like protein
VLGVARVVLALSVAALAAAPAASAQPEVYVDGTSLGAPCSDDRTPRQAAKPRTPWCSLARAAAAAPDGSVVRVRAGAYPELDTSARPTRRITFRPHRGEHPSIGGLSLDGARNLRFERFRITGITTLTLTRGIQLVRGEHTPEGIMLRGAANTLIQGNHIHDLRRDQSSCPSPPEAGSGYALWLVGYSDQRGVGNVIRGNRIARIPNDALQTGSNDDLLFKRNEVTGVHGGCDGDHADSLQIVEGRRITLRDNWFHHSVHGLMVNGHGDTVRAALRIENNLIHDIDGSFGMNLYNVDGLLIHGNTVWDTELGVRIRDTEENPTVMRAELRNNILDAFSSECDSIGCLLYEDYNLIASGDRRGRHDLRGRPRFVNEAADRFELAAGSPAIDAGTSEGASRRDRLGRRRRDVRSVRNRGAGRRPFYDLGAHERQAGRRGSGRSRPRRP